MDSFPASRGLWSSTKEISGKAATGGGDVASSVALSLIATVLGSTSPALAFFAINGGFPRDIYGTLSMLRLWILSAGVASVIAVPIGARVLLHASRARRMRPIAAAVIYGSLGGAVAFLAGGLVGPDDDAMMMWVASWSAVWGASIGATHSWIVRAIQSPRQRSTSIGSVNGRIGRS
jgi:hypothetical protein